MVDTGRLDSSKPIKMDSLHASGAVTKIKHGVKLLGDVSKYVGRLLIWTPSKGLEYSGSSRLKLEEAVHAAMYVLGGL